MMTRQDYIDTVGSLAAAIEFEDSVHQAGSEFLPDYVNRVVDGRHVAADSRYWQFMIDQWNQAQMETERCE